MGRVRCPKYQLLHSFQFLLLIRTTVLCYQYKVGDLDAWALPASTNPLVYSFWANNHIFQNGDSLLFLYPPSQDSVIQVTEQSYNSCNLTDPILYMNDGNFLLNITQLGEFYFTSSVQGRCQESQKLRVSASANGSSSALGLGPGGALPPTSPYPTMFGSIPMSPLSSLSSSSSLSISVVSFLAAIGFWALYFESHEVD